MFNLYSIEAEMIERVKARPKNKRAKFGTALYFRRFKKIKRKDHTRHEPPYMDSPQMFLGDDSTFAQNSREKGSYRPIVKF